MNTPLDAAALVLLLFLPFHLLVLRQLAVLADPGRIRAQGVSLEDPGALESRGEPIGCYAGGEICGWVQFKGMHYRFDRIEPPAYRYRVAARELFLPPGFVYLTD